MSSQHRQVVSSADIIGVLALSGSAHTSESWYRGARKERIPRDLIDCYTCAGVSTHPFAQTPECALGLAVMTLPVCYTFRWKTRYNGFHCFTCHLGGACIQVCKVSLLLVITSSQTFFRCIALIIEVSKRSTLNRHERLPKPHETKRIRAQTTTLSDQHQIIGPSKYWEHEKKMVHPK